MEAIFPEDALPDKWNAFVEINYAFPDPAKINSLADAYATEHDVHNEPIALGRGVGCAGRSLRPASRYGAAAARVAGQRRRRDLRDAEAALAVLDLRPRPAAGRRSAPRACSRRSTSGRRGSRLCRSRPCARNSNGAQPRAAARLRIVEPRGYSHLRAEARVQRRRALGERLEHGAAALGRAVVGDDELGAACPSVSRSETSIRVGAPRRTAWSIASRRIW